MIVAVLGANGVVGRNLVPRLLENGDTVRAAVRCARGTPQPKGVEAVEADVLQLASLKRLVDGTDALVNVASSIPRADGTGGGDWATYDRMRREGTANVIRACDDARIPLVEQSVAVLHCVDQTNPQNEKSPMKASGTLAASLDMERLLAAWNGNWRIVRGGSLYGPGTARDDEWLARYRRGELRTPGDGLDWISPIHVADLAAAFCTVLRDAPPRTAWIASDDAPMRYMELFEIVAELAGRENAAPKTGGEPYMPSFRVTNAALRSLGWRPRYASVRSGLVSVALP